MIVTSPLAPPPPTPSPSETRADGGKRTPRKIRYTADEWAAIVARALACGKAPASYVREVSLGAMPKAKRGNVESSDGRALLVPLARIGSTLNELLRAANASGHVADATSIRAALDELLSVLRRVE